LKIKARLAFQVKFPYSSLGIDGSEGITALAVSPAKKFLAVCEKSERAICTVYDINNPKKKKVVSSNDYVAKEFISTAFSPSNEKSMLLTLVI